MRNTLLRCLVVTSLLLAVDVAFAERLDEEDARQAAASFFNDSADRGLSRGFC